MSTTSTRQAAELRVACGRRQDGENIRMCGTLSHFWPTDYEHGRDFVADLDSFLSKLPKGWPYAIEMRNKHWFHWQRMPNHFKVAVSISDEHRANRIANDSQQEKARTK